MKHKLKLAYLIDRLELTYPRDQNYIIKYVLERGHNVNIITFDLVKASNESLVTFYGNNVNRINIIKLQSIKFKIPIPTSKELLSILKLLNDHDIIHTFTFFTTSSFLGLLTSQPSKVIRSEIGTYLNYRNNDYFADLRGMRKYLINIYKLYDVITVFNHIERKLLEKLKFSPIKIFKVKPMIDYNLFHSLFDKKRVAEDHVIIGTIARITPIKGLHSLCKIFNFIRERDRGTLDKIRFILAGRVENRNYFVKINKCLQLIFGDRYTYLGEVALPYDFYKQIDILIFTSLKETGAITVLEAMAAGKIVIARNVYPINLYIRDGVEGLLFESEKDAAYQLINIIKSPEEDLQYIRKQASDKAFLHDYLRVCKNLEKIYYELVYEQD